MKILHKYIFKQVAAATVMSVSIFVFIMVTINVLRDEIELLADGRMGLDMFFWILLLYLPYVAAFALPLGLLMAVLLVLGRLSAQREITSMRASGLSITQIVAPVLLIALIGVGASSFINFYYSPIARTTQKTQRNNLVRTDPLKLIKPKKFNKELPGVVVYVSQRNENKLRDLWLWELDDQHRVIRFIRADSGDFIYNRDEDVIILNCYNGTAEIRDTSSPESYSGTNIITPSFKKLPMRFSLADILGKESIHRKLSMLTLGELLDFRAEGIAKSKQGDPKGREQQIHAQMQIQENFATSFAALSLALIAIPLGIKVSRSETMANLALALALGLLYTLFMELIGMLKGHPEWRPDILIWIPNIALQALGIYLIRRLSIR